MNVDNYFLEQNISIEALNGDESIVLNRIANELEKHEEWINNHGLLKSKKVEEKVDYLISEQLIRMYG